jgi:hypothetical protein
MIAPVGVVMVGIGGMGSSLLVPPPAPPPPPAGMDNLSAIVAAPSLADVSPEQEGGGGSGTVDGEDSSTSMFLPPSDSVAEVRAADSTAGVAQTQERHARHQNPPAGLLVPSVIEGRPAAAAREAEPAPEPEPVVAIVSLEELYASHKSSVATHGAVCHASQHNTTVFLPHVSTQRSRFYRGVLRTTV